MQRPYGSTDHRSSILGAILIRLGRWHPKEMTWHKSDSKNHEIRMSQRLRSVMWKTLRHIAVLPRGKKLPTSARARFLSGKFTRAPRMNTEELSMQQEPLTPMDLFEPRSVRQKWTVGWLVTGVTVTCSCLVRNAGLFLLLTSLHLCSNF